MDGNLPDYRVAFATPWFTLEESVPACPGELPYYRMVGPDGVVILPLTPDGDILMVRQFRISVGAASIEIPAGAIDSGESPEQAARRELLEETGYRCERIYRLGEGRLYPNRFVHTENFMLALGVTPAQPPGEDGIIPEVLTRPAFAELVRSGKLDQVAALSFFGLASIKLGRDLLKDPIESIVASARAFQEQQA